MEYCRNCGKTTDNRKMMIYCECGGKLISERQYKLEQKDKCNHLIGLHTIAVGEHQGYSLPTFENGTTISKDYINLHFKYCPLCGNKTRFYTKETK